MLMTSLVICSLIFMWLKVEVSDDFLELLFELDLESVSPINPKEWLNVESY